MSFLMRAVFWLIAACFVFFHRVRNKKNKTRGGRTNVETSFATVGDDRTGKRKEEVGALEVGRSAAVEEGSVAETVGEVDVERSGGFEVKTVVRLQPELECEELSSSCGIMQHALSLVVCRVRVCAVVEEQLDGEEEALG